MDYAQQEAERIARLRAQMRQQDERRFEDPDFRTQADTVYALLLWQPKGKRWKFISHTHGKITPKRISQLRRKFRRQISEDSIVRLVDLRAYRANGGGSAPQAPPRSVRATRLAKQTAKVIESLVVRRKLIRPDKRWGKCWKCSHKSVYYLAFTSRGKRIIRKCCRKHAWYQQHLPPVAKCVVVVQRRTDVKLAA